MGISQSRGWKTFPIEVGGGLVDNLPPIQQGVKAPGSATRLVNFEPSISGGYRRINGYTKWDADVVPTVSTANPILGVGIFNNYVIAAREGKIFSSTGSGWTEIATGRTQTTKHRFTTFNLNGTKKIMGVDGSNYPYTWDGSSFVNVNGSTDVQGASHAIEFKDHVFYAKGNLVSFSIPFDETDFTVADGAGSFLMPNNVTGMIVFRQRLFVFTENEIKVLDGSSQLDFALTSVATDVGCIEPDTIQEVSGDVMFLSSDGFRLLGATDRVGDFGNAVSSKQIQEDVRSFKNNFGSFASLVVREKSQYRAFGFNTSTPKENSIGIIGVQFQPQNSESFQWSKTQGLKVYSCDSKVYNGSEVIVFCNEDEYVYEMEDGSTFDGTTIEASYWTPYFTFEDPQVRKTIYKVHMYFTPEDTVSGTIGVKFDQNVMSKIQPPVVSFTADGGGDLFGGAVFGSATFVDAPDSSITKQLVGSGFNASLQFNFEDSQAPFIFDTIMLEYQTEDRR